MATRVVEKCDVWLEGEAGLPLDNNRKAVANATIALLCDEGRAMSRVQKADILIESDGEGSFDIHLASKLEWTGEEIAHFKKLVCMRVMLDIGWGIQRVSLACETDLSDGLETFSVEPQPSIVAKLNEIKETGVDNAVA